MVLDNLNGFRQIHYLSELLDALKFPLFKQIDLFNKIVSQTNNSRFATDFNLKFQNVNDLKQIDLFKPGDLSNIVDDIIKEKLPLDYFSNQIIAFGSSSGTSGKHKLIPITQNRIDQIEKEVITAGYFNREDIFDLIFGDTLFYPAIPFKSRQKIPIVNISGFQSIMAPNYLKRGLSIPSSVWEIEKSEKRDFDIAYYSLLNRNVNHIGFASALVPLNKWIYINNNLDKLLIHMKQQGHDARSEELFNLYNGKLYVDDVFPNLFRITTMKSHINLNDLNKYFEYFRNPDKLKIVECGVNLTEARITYGISGESNPGVPSLTTFVYLFQEFSNGQVIDDRKFVNELEVGKTYNVLVFGNDIPFLWNTEDLFKVTGNYQDYDIPVLNHVSKNNYINFVQEHVHLDDLIKSVNFALQNQNFEQENFFMNPYFENSKKGYNIILPKKDLDYETLVKDIEQNLMDILTYFEARLQHHSLAPIRLQIISNEEFERFNKLEAENNGQYKHKFVHDNIDFSNQFSNDKIIYLDSSLLDQVVNKAYSRMDGLVDK